MRKLLSIAMAAITLVSSSCRKPNCAPVSGYEVVNMETPVSSAVVKQLEVRCPGNKFAVGAGWSVEDSTSAILDGTANYFQPSYDGKSWLVNAKNNSAFSPNWKLRVKCICAEVCK